MFSKGINICPSPKDPNPGDLRFDLDSLHHRLRLDMHFNDEADLLSTPFLEGNHFSRIEFKQHSKFMVASMFNSPGLPVLASMMALNEHDFNNRAMLVSSGQGNLKMKEGPSVNANK